MTTDGTTVAYTYDAYGRISTQVTKRGSTTILTETYTYVNPTSTTTSSQIATYKTESANYSVTYTYTYDDNGNILSVTDGTYPISYEYDSANQVIRENNRRRNRTLVWTYDNAGNILSEKVYVYTTGDISNATPMTTNGYTYGDEDWGDLLTGYNNLVYTYDEIGNPTGDTLRSYTWEHGRQLETLTLMGNTWDYTYDANGLRTKRSSDSVTYEYVYSGDKLVQVIATDHTTTPETVSVVEYAYDAAGQPLTMTLGNDVYYYVLNIQGDVMGLVDSSGTLMITYYYEGYGECYSLSNTSDKAPLMSANNHLLYRGYVVDKGTGLYYLQSRYYDPNVGRFINADAYAATGQGLLGNNMFAYCNNDPVIFKDVTGQALRPSFVAINDSTGGDKHVGTTNSHDMIAMNNYSKSAPLKEAFNEIKAFSQSNTGKELFALNKVRAGTSNILKGLGYICAPVPTLVDEIIGACRIFYGGFRVVQGIIEAARGRKNNAYS